MLDLMIADFKEKLIADINESKLPPTVIAYVLQDVSQQVVYLAQTQITAQKQERARQTQKPAE